MAKITENNFLYLCIYVQRKAINRLMHYLQCAVSRDPNPMETFHKYRNENKAVTYTEEGRKNVSLSIHKLKLFYFEMK